MTAKPAYTGKSASFFGKPIVVLFSGKEKIGESLNRIFGVDLIVKGKKIGVLKSRFDFNLRHFFVECENKTYEISCPIGLRPTWRILRDNKPFLFLKMNMYKEKVGDVTEIMNARKKKIGAIVSKTHFDFSLSSPFEVYFDSPKEKLSNTELLIVLTAFFCPSGA